MDWELAIDRNRQALLRLLALLFASVGMAGGGSVAHVSRSVHLSVLGVLRPAESALRRLIMAVMQDLIAKGYIAPKPRARSAPTGKITRGNGKRAPCFPLFDPRKRFDLLSPHRRGAKGTGPRMFFFDGEDTAPEEAEETVTDAPINAARLCRRLLAMQGALEDLKRQAKRLARVQSRRRAGFGRRYIEPLRAGWPPGHRQRRTREIDEILHDCHALAMMARSPDTS